MWSRKDPYTGFATAEVLPVQADSCRKIYFVRASTVSTFQPG